jgi:hypothetical protein
MVATCRELPMPPVLPLSTLATDQRMILDWVTRSLPVEDVAQRRAALLAEAQRIVQQAIANEPVLREVAPPPPPPPGEAG